ncbi:MAG: aminotransferase class III-fold pyridoxal phosphate-dependent enzyme [bacterium]
MIGAIVQARMGSTRLPGKIMKEIVGKPLLEHLVSRLKGSRLLDKIIVATTSLKEDEIVVELAEAIGIDAFAGSEADVLDRYYQAARKYRLDTVVRITGDCPLIDPKVVDKVIRHFKSDNFDYVSNVFKYTYPDGLDTEVFSFEALERAWREASQPSEREHVTPYIRKHPELFKLSNVENDINLFGMRWCVDEEKDLEFVREVYKNLYREGKIFYMEDILKLLKICPGLSQINEGIIRNEGYYKSLLEQKEPIEKRKRELTQSRNLLNRAKKVIPSCTQTFSKGSTQFVQGVSPIFLKSGEGSNVFDVDDNEYIDYIMALCPVILGYNYEPVNESIREQLKRGITFSLPHYLEVELAELLVDIIPCAEMVRFGKNGSDVTSGAVRAARAYTGRDLIACCGYHGWQDWYIGTTTRNKGVPKVVSDLTLTFEYNHISSLESLFERYKDKIAAVIMEPVGVVEPEDNFLKKVRELTYKNNALLIFDEIVTGFRLSLGGAQEFFGVTPDLACFGKAMANGMPISAIVGKREIMEIFDDIFYSFTFGGEALSLAAAIKTIKVIKDEKVIDHLWRQGVRLRDGYNYIAKNLGLTPYTQCIGYPPRTVITFKDGEGKDDLALKSLFQQEMIKRSILISGGQNLSYSHTAHDIEKTLLAYKETLSLMKKGIEAENVRDMVEGEIVQPVFRRA